MIYFLFQDFSKHLMQFILIVTLILVIYIFVSIASALSSHDVFKLLHHLMEDITRCHGDIVLEGFLTII